VEAEEIRRAVRTAAADAEEIKRVVREQAARHEALHAKLSRVTGPVSDYQAMSTPELAAYGLKKLGLEVPDSTDDPRVVALEHALRGRSNGATGGVPGSMDAAGGRDSFMNRYLSA
jgi:hypothetical protein